MHFKGLILLTLITVVAVGMIIAVIMKQEPQTQETPLHLLFPSLIDTVNTVFSITIRDSTTSTTVERNRNSPEQWTVLQKNNYPANFDKIKEMVIRIAQLIILGPRTNRPQQFHRIDLEDPDQVGSRAIEVILRDENGLPLVSFLRGKTSTFGTTNRPDTFFVRQSDDTQSWLVQGTLTIQAEPMHWIDRTAPQIDRTRVKRIIIRHPDGETLMFERDTQQQQILNPTGLPEGIPKMADINDLIGLVQYVYFDDILPAAELDFSDAVVTDIQTFDAINLSVRIITHAEKDWITFTASAIDTPTQEVTDSTETSETAQDTEDTTTDPTTQAQILNDRYSPWAYQVSAYTANRLRVQGQALVDSAENVTGEE